MNQTIAILFITVTAMLALPVNTIAQPNLITVTNVVTITETNFVTVTNVLPAAGGNAKPPSESAANQMLQPIKYPWESSFSAGLTLTRGNSSTLLVTGGAQTHKKTPDNEFGLGADGAYGVNNAVKDVDTVHGFGQYNHLFNERIYAYARVEGLHDGVADLQYRITVGPGAGYYLIKQTNTALAVELGSSFVCERLGNVDDSYATLRLAERFEHKFTGYNARLWENAEILPQVNKLDNYIVNAEIGIESSISKSVSLKTFLVENYNNQPAAGRDKNDIKLVSGISYKF